MDNSKLLLLWACCILLAPALTFSQTNYWQQAVQYEMEIDFDVKKHRFSGEQQLTYTNNSPDTLFHVYYHLFYNAFQPGSMMDIRNRELTDRDRRMTVAIDELEDEEIGYQKINSLKQDGVDVTFVIAGSILEVNLPNPILPGQQVVFNMDFDAQVPIMIRRTGRDNKEGIAYSMGQWYPKMVEYDYQGWHTNPFIGREFHGVWGDFDVKITIDGTYVIGGSGYLQNPHEIGFGYDGPRGNRPPKRRKKTYHFVAPNVHDFAWGADPEYTHSTLERADGVTLHCFYQPGEATTENWELLPGIMDRALDFINENYGQYPYNQYSFIQGGDSGMEYPMATLITGERPLVSLVGVSVHEIMHAWYQGVIATNESLHGWMDEGFTNYASAEVMNYLRSEGLIPGEVVEDPHLADNPGLTNFIRMGLEEPLSTHADHFSSASAYAVATYTKGAVFLHQLNYIMGEETFKSGMLRYFNEWKFKHPNPNDFIRVMEKEADMELDWFREYFVNTTHIIDYGIEAVEGSRTTNTTKLTLQKIGRTPMPIDVQVVLHDGAVRNFTIPLRIMRGEKSMDRGVEYELLPDWFWVSPEYEVDLPISFGAIKSVTIDASERMLDIDRSNNHIDL